VARGQQDEAGREEGEDERDGRDRDREPAGLA
jgi:hypothetical protein